MLAMLQWCNVCCINNPRGKHFSQTAWIIYLLGSLRTCGTCSGNSLLCTIHCCVCVRWGGWGGGTGIELLCLAKGAPSVFPLPWSRSQGFLGCVSTAINFSSISGMTFGGISMLSLGGVGPLLCRQDPGSCHCLVCTEGICVSVGLKIPQLGPLPCPSFPRPQTDWMIPTLTFPHLILSLFSHTGHIVHTIVFICKICNRI